MFTRAISKGMVVLYALHSLDDESVHCDGSKLKEKDSASISLMHHMLIDYKED